jgi:hypothetical protein
MTALITSGLFLCSQGDQGSPASGHDGPLPAPAGAAAPVDITSQAAASGAGRTTGRTTATAPEVTAPVTNAHNMRTRGKDGFR